MYWRNRIFSIAVMIGFTAGCDSYNVQSTARPQAKNMRGSASKEVKIASPNAMGFSKISIRDGGIYQESIVDSNQKEVIRAGSNMLVCDISGSLALVQFERKFLFVPLDKGVIAQEEMAEVAGFQYAERYQCGLALVVVEDNWFYINAEGEKAFEGDFVFAESFHHDRALVKTGDQYQIIDTQGKTVAHLGYNQVSLQSPWCWQVTRIENGKYKSGFIDLEGKEITDLTFEEVGYYDPTVKRIHVGKRHGEEIRYGFLDEFANTAIPIQFHNAEVFDKGIARVTLDGRSYFINPEGVEVPQ